MYFRKNAYICAKMKYNKSNNFLCLKLRIPL